MKAKVEGSRVARDEAELGQFLKNRFSKWSHLIIFDHVIQQ